MYRSGWFPVEIVRKSIKNLHVGVYPRDGRIRVAAPESVSQDAVRVAILTRLPWIKRQKISFEGQAREARRQFVSGETHFVFGRPHRLQVVKGSIRHRLEIEPDRMFMHAPEDSTAQKRANYTQSWQRRNLREKAAPRMEEWATSLNLPVPTWGIRRMKTKWGSCNTQAKRIWLNLELAKKPPECLEYILVHELVHLLERNHNERFKGYMDKLLPDWRERRDLLNRMPLAHNNWIY